MRDYTIDSWTEKIYHAKTREYFTEVIKSYYSESYRSAVVMLYSIVIVDLLYKMNELVEIYSDSKAEKILDEIKKTQEKKPNSAEWESKLIELINERMSFFEKAEYLNILNLQKHRHLCAHPVLGNSYELYKPNRETTSAHIRNMLDDVLIQSPLLSKDIFEKILSDLSENKNRLNENLQISQYITGRYINKVSNELLIYLYRNMWKVVFRDKTDEAESNRDINFKALHVFLEKRYNILFEAMQNEITYYSEVDVKFFHFLIILINYFNRIFDIVSESLKILLVNSIKENADKSALAIFKSINLEEHINKVIDMKNSNDFTIHYISVNTIIEIANFIKVNKESNFSNLFLIEMFGQSRSYDIANDRFDKLIKPNVNDFNLSELSILVRLINDNSQIYGRYGAKQKNTLIKQRIEQLESRFDFNQYENFQFFSHH